MDISYTDWLIQHTNELKEEKILKESERMNVKQFFEKYGEQATEELLDIIHIKHKSMKRDNFMIFAKKYGIVGRGTQTMRVVNNVHWTSYDNVRYYRLTLKNGRGDYVLDVQEDMRTIPTIDELKGQTT